jgi:hypothetical protein
VSGGRLAAQRAGRRVFFPKGQTPDPGSGGRLGEGLGLRTRTNRPNRAVEGGPRVQPDARTGHWFFTAEPGIRASRGVEVAVKAAVPEIVAIVDTTAHASGTNPDFTPSKK